MAPAAVALIGALVLDAGLAALPALVRFLRAGGRAGGWRKIRRRVGWAVGVTGVVGGGLVATFANSVPPLSVLPLVLVGTMP